MSDGARPRLGASALGELPRGVARFGYDRNAQASGIVHFGIGAFHRAHQAWYADRAMEGGDRGWMIDGVSLRSSTVARQMNPQQGLYTLAERGGEGAYYRVIGSVRRVLSAPDSPEAIIAALAAPGVHIASLTVTEKGYCRAADGSLDAALADERSVFAYLASGLRRRHDAGLPGLTLLSCDNLADNGGVLARLMRAYLDRRDPALLAWFDAECACPSTMVDRIVPATTEADLRDIEEAIGCADLAAVSTEPFSQWVIEDRFAGPRPRWEKLGVDLVATVAPYETAKLRMLNGAHSALAYLGLRRGHAYVHQAVADPVIRPLIETLMRDEAAPTIDAAPGQDLGAYAADLLARFANPALRHRLAQIAIDGSQKVPQRWLATLADAARQGRRCPAILAALAAWLDHLRGANGPVDDPRAGELADVWARAGREGIVAALFGSDGALASDWRPDDADRAAIMAGLSE